MQISKKGLDLIKSFEGFMAKPYHCSAGVATIGYGTTVYPDGTLVQMDDIAITEQEASNMMKTTINDDYGAAVNRYAPRTEKQYRFDALVSFTYNLGSGNLRSSTLLKKHNLGDFKGAEKEFVRWNKAGGKELAGLTRRRKAEAKMYSGL